MLDPNDLTMESLSSEDSTSDFHCGEPELDKYFRTQAGQDQRRNVSRTSVARRPHDHADLPSVLGFFTLTMGELHRETLPENVRKKLPYYPVPVLVLARLAVDERARGKGIGEALLMNVYEHALEISTRVGCFGIVADAKHEKAASFYRRYGFDFIDSPSSQAKWPWRMFVSLETIRKSR